MRRKAIRRLAFAEAQNWRCCYCGGVMTDFERGPALATREHLLPHSQGGTWAAANTVAACLSCNRVRSDDFTCKRFARLRRGLARKGVWPPCTYPNERAKRIIRGARGRSIRAAQSPAPRVPAAVVFSETSGAESPQDAGHRSASGLNHVVRGTPYAKAG